MQNVGNGNAYHQQWFSVQGCFLFPVFGFGCLVVSERGAAEIDCWVLHVPCSNGSGSIGCVCLGVKTFVPTRNQTTSLHSAVVIMPRTVMTVYMTLYCDSSHLTTQSIRIDGHKEKTGPVFPVCSLRDASCKLGCCAQGYPVSFDTLFGAEFLQKLFRTPPICFP